MYIVTLTGDAWPTGHTREWTTDSTQLEWFKLKQQMGMHPSMHIINVEEFDPQRYVQVALPETP